MSYRVYDYDEYDPREDNAWGVFYRFEDFVKEYKDKLAFLEDKTDNGWHLLHLSGEINDGAFFSYEDAEMGIYDVTETLREVQAEKTDLGFVLTAEEKQLAIDFLTRVKPLLDELYETAIQEATERGAFSYD